MDEARRDMTRWRGRQMWPYRCFFINNIFLLLLTLYQNYNNWSNHSKQLAMARLVLTADICMISYGPKNRFNSFTVNYDFFKVTLL